MKKITIEAMLQQAYDRLQNYHNDIEIDRNSINTFPGVPFIHLSRDNGTHMIILQTEENLPAPGEQVPYLFGTRDRAGVIIGIKESFDYFMSRDDEHHYTVHYFNGEEVKKINMKTADEIVNDYIQRELTLAS